MNHKRFEILCVTMHQNDFSKLKEMNIHSDIVYANQCDHTSYKELLYDEVHSARMISTQTRGVGINRNLTLMYADADYCLFGDDDVQYVDDLETIVIDEFDSHKDADVFIFNIESTDSKRPQKKYSTTRKCRPLERMPWGCVRVAFRLNSVKQANLWFTTLFGGGCTFASGEDSMWLIDAKRAGLKMYISEKTIGKVSFDESSWFTGADEKFFFSKGAFYQAKHPFSKMIWMLYFAFRVHNSQLSFSKKFKAMMAGAKAYKNI